MKKNSLLAAACIATTLSACTVNNTPKTTTGAPIEYQSVAAQVPYQALTQLPVAQPNQRINYGTEPSQYAELWLPAAKDAPVVAFIHGGCWLSAYDIKHSQAFATALRDQGFAVWNIEYRRAGEPGGGWPGSLNDIHAALTALGQQQLNLDQVTLMGHSAGGHLALLAAQQSSVDIDTVIGLAAITDLASYASGNSGCEQGAQAFMGGTPAQLEAAYQLANPASQPEPDTATLLIHGTDDTVVPLQQAQLPGATTLEIREAGHFDMIHPGAPAWRHIITALRQSLQSSAPSQESAK
ncbi:Acetyl esterase/lipase [Pseudidiomarina planktonica]|uniref:Acetyl esterase/lipase n=1 Tax=Pseudidiomarina planktonica TaxID=1323738 RepID=A0A1Y6FXK3_9GAMM|nr:alpha/beta hydrolase [Pseudidiomarina planktonica]SMQ80386.1 Acetyl esterase/lipase [Pseudidiomarina planktonica]